MKILATLYSGSRWYLHLKTESCYLIANGSLFESFLKHFILIQNENWKQKNIKVVWSRVPFYN